MACMVDLTEILDHVLIRGCGLYEDVIQASNCWELGNGALRFERLRMACDRPVTAEQASKRARVGEGAGETGIQHGSPVPETATQRGSFSLMRFNGTPGSRCPELRISNRLYEL